MAMGDPRKYGWGKTNFAVYSGAFTGFLGSIVHTTDVEKILRIDLDRLDFFQDSSYPSWLCYNPYKEDKTVTIPMKAEGRMLYDAVTHRVVGHRNGEAIRLTIPADQAMVLVDVPAKGKWTYDDAKLLIDGIVVDYAAREVR